MLVGMNREMVIYAKGAPREKDPRERRRYGIRRLDLRRTTTGRGLCALVGDEVVRVETMKMAAKKSVRTEKEIDLGGSAVATAARKKPGPSRPRLCGVQGKKARARLPIADRRLPGRSPTITVHRRRSLCPLIFRRDAARPPESLALPSCGQELPVREFADLAAPFSAPLHWKSEDCAGADQSHGRGF